LALIVLLTDRSDVAAIGYAGFVLAGDREAALPDALLSKMLFLFWVFSIISCCVLNENSFIGATSSCALVMKVTARRETIGEDEVEASHFEPSLFQRFARRLAHFNRAGAREWET
jgi:hypothetical protein